MSKPLSDQEKKSVEHRFDSYCKKVLRGTAINYDKKINRLAEHEISISDLPENVYAAYTDEYFQQDYFFEVSGEIIVVKNTGIADAVTMLSIMQREIILLSYFSDMTDIETSRKLGIRRSKVQYQRKAALEILKEIMGDEKS